MKDFFKSPWLLIAAFVIYISVLGPALMSAPSTIAVLANIILLILFWLWTYKMLTRLLRVTKPNTSDQSSTSTSTNKE